MKEGYIRRGAAVLLGAAAFAAHAGGALALEIMPLGDSITEGLCSSTMPGVCENPYNDPANAYNLAHYNSGSFDFCGTFAKQMVENYNMSATGGYRGPLLAKLRAAGFTANYKGHVASGTALAVADRKHEGHGGWGTQHVAYCVNGYLAAQSPDTVLLDIGANNLTGGETPSAVATNIVAIKSQIETKVPKPRVLTALLSPGSIVSDYANKTKQVNALVAAQSGRDYPCTARDLPDMSVLTAADLQDGLHPNAAGYEKMAAIWFNAISTPECKFDSRTYVSIGGVLVESITAYGRYWNFNAGTGAWMGNGPLNTADIARYKLICNTKPVCTFDTRTFLPSTSGTLESITAFDSYWTFSDSSATPVATGTLRSVPRYNQYICALSSNSGCKFDTRTIIDRAGTQVEAITAYGRYFEFNYATGALLASGTLASTTRYGQICAYKPASDLYCAFDTRTYVQIPGYPYLESITAYGRYWNFQESTGTLVDAGQLKDIHGRYFP
jgi:lysophospholipase L1-like esterase